MAVLRARTVSILAALVFAPLTHAQSDEHQHSHAMPSPPAGQGSVEATHHAFLDQERAAIARGEGFGMAMVADHNGYPGPKHVLELKDKLQLTTDQEAAMEKLFAKMKEGALAKGKEVLDAEIRLEQMFADGRAEVELRAQTERIAALRADLRWVHLAAHLEARKLLTPEQLADYQHLRHHADHAMTPSAGAL